MRSHALTPPKLTYRADMNAPLNRDLLSWHLHLPLRRGSNIWFDLVSSNNAIGSNMDGTAWRGARDRIGGCGATVYDGSDDFQTLSDHESATNWSIAAWLNVTGVSAFPAMVAVKFGAVGGNGIAMFNLQFRPLRNNAIASNSGAFTFTNNTWYHVVSTWDGSTSSIWVDGVQQTGGAADTGWGLTAGYFGRGYSTYRFNGWMDDVRVYRRVLPGQEIADLRLASMRGYRRELLWLFKPIINASAAPPAGGSKAHMAMGCWV